MAEEDQDQRTEHPTGKRLGEARDRGQLAVSREISAWMVILAILMTVAWLGPPMMQHLIQVLRVFLESPHAMTIDPEGLRDILFGIMSRVGLATGLIFILLATAAILGIMLQTGLFASLDLIKIDFARLSPASGMKRLFSTNALVELVKSFCKLVLLGTAVFFTLLPVTNNLPAFTGRPLMDAIAFLHSQATHLIIILLLVFTLVALGDLFYQRYQYIKNLRMTKAEVKDEYKQQEGDPTIKARLRQIRLEKARKRMMAQVPKADVVITNPTHYAVALKYDNGRMAAPTLIAKGIETLAQRIREVAEENKVPLVSNPPLARGLYDSVEIDEQIPHQYYRAVAEIISYVYKLKKRKL